MDQKEVGTRALDCSLIRCYVHFSVSLLAA